MAKTPSISYQEYITRKTVAIVAVQASVLLIIYMSWDFWFIRKPESTDVKEKGDLPFDVSNTNIIFEIGAGSFISLVPLKPFTESVDIKVQLDDAGIINTIGSFTVQALSTHNVFIPIYSKEVAGHCIMSFRTSSKLPELQNLFKIRINIKAVHQIEFGYLSIILGWAYFCCWGAFYYPQIYKNWKRKSVVGFSFDYLALNLTGHICYCVFNVAMFYNTSVQKSYTKLHPRGELPVHLNDVLFTLHSVVMNIVLVAQCLLYERGGQRVSLPMWTFVGGLWFTILSTLVASIMEKINWLQYLYYLSYIKVGTTPIKYTPQMYLNYLTKSTEGWSIYAVMFDMLGGILSFLQMGIDAINNDDWDGTWGNPGKLGLSCIAVLYNIIFLLQHFGLYNHPTSPVRVHKNTEKGADQSVFLEKLNQLKRSFNPPKVSHVVFDL